jgi:hypothetical protein
VSCSRRLLCCACATRDAVAANNGVLHSIVNAAGFWKALWKSEVVGAAEVEAGGCCTWQHALQQLRAIEGLQDEAPCDDADAARLLLQHATLCSTGNCPPDCSFSFIRLSQRRSFKVDPSLLECICFCRTPLAITVTCVPLLPPPHVLNGRPPSSYLPMCASAPPGPSSFNGIL